MPDSFDVIYLGSAVDLDPNEATSVADNAAALVGVQFGSAVSPLASAVQTMAPGTAGYSSGIADGYDQTGGVDQFQIDGGADRVFDSVIEYSATITYSDGTTATIIATVIQDDTGELFLVPPETQTSSADALEAGPIQSITLDSVHNDDLTDLSATRQAIEFVQDDGVVEGTAGNDVIDASYTGDPSVETVDGVDGDNDVIHAAGGDDIVSAGAGDDTIVGGEGNDVLVGGAGNDIIYGDDTVPAEAASTAEYLSWSAVGAHGTDLTGGFVYDSGLIDVKVSFDNDGTAGANVQTGLQVSSFQAGYTNANDSIVDPANMVSISGTGDDISTTTLEFSASDGAGVLDGVQNVSFRLQDIDGSAGFSDNITVLAYDEFGDPVVVVLNSDGANTEDNIAGNSVTAAPGANAFSDANGSVLVEIAGPVSRVDIIYSGLSGGTTNQYAAISEIHYETIPASGGDDSLTGGAGDDIFVAGSGHDTINDFGTGNTGSVDDGDQTNNDFVDLSEYYNPTNYDAAVLAGHIDPNVIKNPLQWLKYDQANDGVLNDSYAGWDASNTLTINNSGSPVGAALLTGDTTNVVCFTSGTAIRTPQGDRLIDDLRVGDLVCTLDNGPQKIRWIGRRTLSRIDLERSPNIRPILIKKEVMGAERDLMVSPQHGILLSQDDFVRAKHLVSIPNSGIRVANGQKTVTYIHLLFDSHQVIFAEGVPSESFFPGKMALKSQSKSVQDELFELFPDLRWVSAGDGDPEIIYGNRARPLSTAKHVRAAFNRVFCGPQGRKLDVVGLAK